jgi:Ca-activated chloride channel family protein
VYAENDTKAALDQARSLLVREALAFGLPSAETAFVATRTEAGQPVGGTVLVANALPAGWLTGSSSTKLCLMASGAGGGAPVQGTRMYARAPAAPTQASGGILRKKALRGPDSVDSYLMDFDAEKPESVAPAGKKPIQVSIRAGQHPAGAGTVLYDSARDAAGQPLAPAGRLTSLRLSFPGPGVTADSVGPDLAVLVFVGDMAEPRARVRLADVLRQGGRRPLNLRWQAGQAVRLTLDDPDARWQTGVPALEITLEWES